MAKNGRKWEGTQGAESGSGDAASLSRSVFSLLRSSAFLGGSLLLAGCLAGGQQVDQAMQADKGSVAARNAGVVARYFVGCPDVLNVHIAGRLEPGGRLPVGPDGRIDLGALGRLRVEGQTTAEIEQRVAELAEAPLGQVRVRVAEYNSQQIYLFGEVTGLQRAVAYQGEETVADLLQRAGGITAGAAPAHVRVIRPRVVEGRPPLVHHVDLQAVVLNKDASTNIRVQPFDQIYVSQTRRSSMHKCVPPLFRPFYEALCGLQRRPGEQEDKETRRQGDRETRGWGEDPAPSRKPSPRDPPH